MSAIYSPQSDDFLSTLSDFANVVVAAFSLYLAYYIFRYERRKAREDGMEAARLTESNIKLQWFKELIIQPNLSKVFEFYDNLNDLENKINDPNPAVNDKVELMNYVKKEAYALRRHFINSLETITPELHNRIRINIEVLVDSLTNAIDNDVIDLQVSINYTTYIETKIYSSKNHLLSLIYNYRNF